MADATPPSRRDDPRDQHLHRLQEWRGRRERDTSIGGFVKEQFKREVERPFKQLGDLSQLWLELMPPHLCEQSRLEGLSRGLLRVVVTSSSVLYELDRLLRDGVESELKTRHKGPAFRKVQLRVGKIE